jgi:predicted acyl esterase
LGHFESRNFSRFNRNRNTGGNNVDEDHGAIADNAVHYDSQHPSKTGIMVVSDA